MSGIREFKVDKIRQVVLVGAGTMGEGIAQCFAQAGIKVKLLDQTLEILDRCVKQIEINIQQFFDVGLLHENPSAVKSRIEPILSTSLPMAVNDCDMVIEIIPEILDLKRQLFNQLDSLRPDIILASNTSSFTITTLAEGLKYPERVVGLHYFNPAHIVPLVEIHRGSLTSNALVDTMRELMLKTGKQPILVKKVVPGFIVNRIQGAVMREIAYLIDNDIVTAEDLDTAIKSSVGLRYALFGPLEQEDVTGLDTSVRIGASVFKTLSNATEPSAVLKEKVNRGELGLKSGRGWYDYTGKTRSQILSERNLKLMHLLKSLQAISKSE
jgi:3-hydroxybutyryl-CoA dehydrogenase